MSTNRMGGGIKSAPQLEEAVEIFARSSALLLETISRHIRKGPTHILSDSIVEKGVSKSIQHMVELVKTHESTRIQPNGQQSV